MSKFTEQQIKDWRIYEEVRQEGRFNMFDPNARTLTGLSKDRYGFVMDNYAELQQEAEK